MENSLKSLVSPSQSVLILLPTKPYFDQVAAGLSLYLALKNEKDVTISCPSEMLVEVNRLVGVNKVVTELGNKNLVIKFINYKASGIERVSYDIENGEFRLTVIPKPGVTPPQKNQLEVGYSGVSSDLVILIGGANESHFPSLSSKDLLGIRKIHIGTRALNLEKEKDVVSFARPASSISEVVAELIKNNNYSIDADIATNIVMGMEEGSNNFTSNGTSVETFEIFAFMLRKGGQRRPRENQQNQVGLQTAQSENVANIEESEPPKDWTGPKIYKGTSVS